MIIDVLSNSVWKIMINPQYDLYSLSNYAFLMAKIKSWNHLIWLIYFYYIHTKHQLKENTILIPVLFCSDVGIWIFHRPRLICEYFVDNQRQLLVRPHHPNLKKDCNNMKYHYCNIVLIMTFHQTAWCIFYLSVSKGALLPHIDAWLHNSKDLYSVGIMLML